MNILKKILIEEDLYMSLGWLGLDYKKALVKRISKSLYILMFFFFLFVAFKNYFYILLGIIFSFFYYKYLYYEIKKKRSSLILIKRRMFPSFVKKILILLRTNNIYKSLSIMIDFTDEPYKKYLIELVSDIDLNKGISPYTDFAKKLEFDEAMQIMLMIYTFTNVNKSDKHLESLDSLISKLYDNELEEAIEVKKRMLWIYPNYTILTMLVLIFSIAIYMFIDVLSKVSF